MFRVLFIATGVLTMLGVAAWNLQAIPLDNQRSLQPLRLGGPVPANEQPPKAYFYNGGKKIYLDDTELAVVKLKKDVRPERAAIRPASLTADSPLKDLKEPLENANSLIVTTSGPGSLNLQKATDENQDIEYILPIVRPAGAKKEKDYWILTPRITAGFTKDLATQEAVSDYVKPFGLKVKRKTAIPGTYILELTTDKVTYTKLLEVANKLHEQGTEAKKVVDAYPDFIPMKKRQGEPGDPNFKNQWHLHNLGQGGGTAGADVRAIDAWRITRGSRNIRIAIIDDSVQKGHPDLAANYVAGRYYNGVTDEIEDDPSPRTGRQRHGTACAGVAVATSNTIGGTGVAPECGLIGVHFWDATATQTAEAFRYCADQGASIISCSWSWQSQEVFTKVSAVINDISSNGRDGKGIVVLFAAGNEHGTVQENQWFGRLSPVICVGASNWKDSHAAYSNHGPEVTVVAPSNDIDTDGALSIETTDNTDDMPRLPGRVFSGYATGEYTGNGETGFGGTSSATPLTAGVCALILSVNSDLTAYQVREVLISTADKISSLQAPGNYNPTTGHSLYYGYGRVNAAKAVEKAITLRTGR